MKAFGRDGWRRFAPERRLCAWVDAVRPAALATLRAGEFACWWRNEGTWFVGVNALPNDSSGAVEGGPGLAGRAVELARRLAADGGAGGSADGRPVAWDRAQVSAVLPGFPRQGEDSDAAFAFRTRRDGAHLDGLHPVAGGRYLRELPAFLLGIALTRADAGASPLVVWEGSHRIMGQMLRKALAGLPPHDWGSVDLSAPYRAARAHCFRVCRRVPVHLRPGEACVMHRFTLHGISPWQEGARSAPPGRVIAYFRPEHCAPQAWLAG